MASRAQAEKGFL
jgi:hypothetical protein